MNLTIERICEVVNDAPEGSGIFLEVDDRDCTYFAKTSEYSNEPAMVWSVSAWESVDDGYPHNGRLDHKPYIPIEVLRKAIADHNRIDKVSDIRNHISPNTRVLEHNNMHCQHGYDVACLICGFGTVDGKRVWHNKTEPKKGDRVKVDFIGESATIYSGKRFTGYGVLDRVEDDRVFGRLDDGTPFMCLCADVEVIEK